MQCKVDKDDQKEDIYKKLYTRLKEGIVGEAGDLDLTYKKLYFKVSNLSRTYIQI